MNFRHCALWLLTAFFAVPTLAEAQAKAAEAGSFEAEAQTWEAMRKHMYTVADALVGGIAKQFPDRFKASAS
jgi:hypothetical protein